MKYLLKQIRSNITTGILILIPSVTALYVLIKLFTLIDSFLPNIISSILPLFPNEWLPGLGILLILIISWFVGLSAKNYIGKLIIDSGNAVVSKIPLINKIFLGTQQVLDAIISRKKGAFDRPVLIEYPKKDSYCIAFIASETTGEIPEKVNNEMFSIFVPTTPNPTSGFLLFLPKSQVINLDMTVETAIKTVMSAGLLNSDQIKKTDQFYRLPKHLKKWNWLKIFSQRNQNKPFSDPRD